MLCTAHWRSTQQLFLKQSCVQETYEVGRVMGSNAEIKIYDSSFHPYHNTFAERAFSLASFILLRGGLGLTSWLAGKYNLDAIICQQEVLPYGLNDLVQAQLF